MSGLPPQLRLLIGKLKDAGYEFDENDPAQVVALLQSLYTDDEPSEPEEIPEKVLSTLDIDGVATCIKEGKAKKIVVMVGAGLSTAAGIPDFRTPGTGLYDNLQKYNLPRPEAIFSIDYFRDNPGAFYELAREMWPGTYAPTKAHYFLKLLEDKELLLRCYSQNIDSLEELAGVSQDLIIAAHGNFSSAHGLDSGDLVPMEEVKEAVMRGEKGWKEMTEKRGELVKPDIVFFGEELPERFSRGIRKDFPACDLLIVMGTSLVVAPFCNCITFVEKLCPRLLINREHAGMEAKKGQMGAGTMRGGFRFDDEARNYRDVFFQGDCDAGVEALCDLLGWREDLERLSSEGRTAFGKASDGAGDAADLADRMSKVSLEPKSDSSQITGGYGGSKVSDPK